MLRIVITVLTLSVGLSASGRAASLHPLVRGFLAGRTSPFLHDPGDLSRGSAETLGQSIGLLVTTRDGGRSLESSGLLPPGECRLVRTARWSAEEIRRAMNDPQILDLSPAVRCFPSLDSSLVETFTTNTHDGAGSPPVYEGLTGDMVIVGIVDSGIDLTHPDFIDDLGGTRILYVWDQTAGGQNGPGRFDPQWAYGKEWTSGEIGAGIATETDPDGHGTHVAGIAAGNGRATGNGQPAYTYVGMAPNALIVVVKTLFYTDTVVHGAGYVFKVAEELGLPAVVNLSLGTQEGPHDGTDPFDQALNALTGPGKMIVAAAGNDRGDGIHAERILNDGESATVTFEVPQYTANPGTQDDDVYIDTWFAPDPDLSLTVVSPNQWTVGPINLGDQPMLVDTNDGTIAMEATHSGVNGDTRVTIDIYDRISTRPPAAGTWTIRIDAAAAAGPAITQGEIDLWLAYYTMGGPPRFVEGVEEQEIVASPASADSLLAVAAYVTKRSWMGADGRRHGYVAEMEFGDIASFSSVGPRRDGALKPDVAAPGMGIGSALSAATQGIPPAILLADGKHMILQGTSMAAPHVTGLVALMFQNNPTLTPGEIIHKVRSTARADAFTGAVPDSMWGYGKMDALVATDYVTPALLLDASARQDGDHVSVRFLMTGEIGNDPLAVWREVLDDGAGRLAIGTSSAGPARTFEDSTLTESGVVRYWMEVRDGSRSIFLGPATVEYRTPAALALACSPQPSAGPVRIAFRLPPELGGEVALFDLAGRRVCRIAAETQARGPRSIVWDRRDENGRPVPSGTYWIRLTASDGRRLSQPLTLLR